jgi:hydroxymethylpyrimidine pyrophosphatase-like HAD family hydrolase
VLCRGPDRDIRIVALDMDGTLLNSCSRVNQDVASVIKAACQSGLQVLLATGKARPAALAACRDAGLEGDGLLVSTRSPGVFLQVNAALCSSL